MSEQRQGKKKEEVKGFFKKQGDYQKKNVYQYIYIETKMCICKTSTNLILIITVNYHSTEPC